MSDDLQKTNVAEGKPVTIDDIRLAIVGDKDKLLLINVFVIVFENPFVIIDFNIGYLILSLS